MGGHCRHPNRGIELEYLEVVLGMPLEELLTKALPHARIRRHEYSWSRAVLSGLPAAFGAGDAAVGVELRGRFAEVPDVAVPILRIPVGGPLGEPSLLVQVVVHCNAR